MVRDCRSGRGRFSVAVPDSGHSRTTAASTPGDYRRAVKYLHALSNTPAGRFYSGDSLFGIAPGVYVDC